MKLLGRKPACPVCGTRLRDGECFQQRLAENERPNPARYQYGALVDRRAIDAHLSAWGVALTTPQPGEMLAAQEAEHVPQGGAGGRQILYI